MQRELVAHRQTPESIHDDLSHEYGHRHQLDRGRTEAGGRQRGAVPASARFGACGLGGGR